MSRVEIAELLGISPQRVHVLIRRPDFPPPVLTLGIGQIWEREAVEDWARNTGRLGTDDDL